MDEVYKDYIKNIDKWKEYKDLDQVMYIATSLKFLQNEDLRTKLSEITEEISGNIGERIENIKNILLLRKIK